MAESDTFYRIAHVWVDSEAAPALSSVIGRSDAATGRSLFKFANKYSTLVSILSRIF